MHLRFRKLCDVDWSNSILAADGVGTVTDLEAVIATSLVSCVD